MRLSIIILIWSTLFGLNSCNSSKNTKTPIADEAIINNTVKEKEQVKVVEVEVVKQTVPTAQKEESEVETHAKPEDKVKLDKFNVDEVTADGKIPQEDQKAKEPTTQPSKKENTVLDKVNVNEVVATDKEEASQQKAVQKVSLVGKYKWIKRECCGRMRKVTHAEPGEDKYMTLTEDGKVLYSGNAAKGAENMEYSIETNLRTFPDRPMLKMGKTVNALYHFMGDTLLIDRGYIDLDKNYWLKME